MKAAWDERCMEAAYGFHGMADRFGCCPYCRAHIDAPLRRPNRWPPNDLDGAYRYFYDPDFGAHKDDVYG